jgi:hypothetical protein
MNELIAFLSTLPPSVTYGLAAFAGAKLHAAKALFRKPFKVDAAWSNLRFLIQWSGPPRAESLRPGKRSQSTRRK